MENEETNNLETDSDINNLWLVHAFIKDIMIKNGIIEGATIQKAFTVRNLITNQNEADIIFQYISDLYGYAGFPQIVPNKKYKSLKVPSLFRSADNFDHLANTLVDFNRHYGWGRISSGLYSSPNKKHALFFHSHVINGKNRFVRNRKRYMEFKLDSQNVIPSKKLQKILEEFSYKLLQTDEKLNAKLIELKIFLRLIANDPVIDGDLFMKILTDDLSKIAIILGFDAIVLENSMIKSVAVLNREKMVLSEHEYKRILKNSSLYSSFLEDCSENFSISQSK